MAYDINSNQLISSLASYSISSTQSNVPYCLGTTCYYYSSTTTVYNGVCTGAYDVSTAYRRLCPCSVGNIHLASNLISFRYLFLACIVGPIVQYAGLWLLGPIGSNCYATCAMLNASSTCAPAATAGTTYGWQSMNIIVNITFESERSHITGQKRVDRCRA